MKLINYYYGYNPIFECSIHGKIVMTAKEWKDAYNFLKRTKKIDSYFKKVLTEDVERTIPTRNGSYLLNVRVSATEVLVEKYNLSNYKRGNYMIEVVL
jgi:hypothetical protein